MRFVILVVILLAVIVWFQRLKKTLAAVVRRPVERLFRAVRRQPPHPSRRRLRRWLPAFTAACISRHRKRLPILPVQYSAVPSIVDFMLPRFYP
ncbi:putative exported protein [Collimonas arenae]|nr:putative exported protein [Collimonas arenae]